MIQQLPTGYRLVLNTYSLEGFKHHEIATLLEISEGTSKSQLSKIYLFTTKDSNSPSIRNIIILSDWFALKYWNSSGKTLSP
jgi:RNA polymerase sigma-70 factor (ECF subfamily)